MSNKKNKYYVVWQGHNPGVYTDWNDCHKQLAGYSAPVFKAFLRLDIAQKAFYDKPEKYLHQDYTEPLSLNFSIGNEKVFKINRPTGPALTVDAACSGNPGVMEYRGVDLETGKEVFRKGPFPLGTNNIGEFLALVHGIALLHQAGDLRPIYTDSKIAISWVRRKQARSLLERNEKTKELYNLIERAENWLKNHKWQNQIIKWETDVWGEIPADFGRK